jgi:hypothetical protein
MLSRIWSTDYLLKALFSSPHQVKQKLFNVHADITKQAIVLILTLRQARIKHCRVF